MLLLQALRSSSTSLRLRQFAHAVPPITVTKIKLLEKEKVLLVTFGSGETCRLPAEYLRIESPAAGNQDSRDASGRLKVPAGRRHVNILKVEPVGAYAVRLQFDDLHGTGIYTWPYLHQLCEEKVHRMRQYIAALRQRGLSRDPRPPRKRSGQAGKAP